MKAHPRPKPSLISLMLRRDLCADGASLDDMRLTLRCRDEMHTQTRTQLRRHHSGLGDTRPCFRATPVISYSPEFLHWAILRIRSTDSTPSTFFTNVFPKLIREGLQALESDPSTGRRSFRTTLRYRRRIKDQEPGALNRLPITLAAADPMSTTPRLAKLEKNMNPASKSKPSMDVSTMSTPFRTFAAAELSCEEMDPTIIFEPALQYFRELQLNRVVSELNDAVTQQKKLDRASKEFLEQGRSTCPNGDEQSEEDTAAGFIDWVKRHDWIDGEVARILEVDRLAQEKRLSELPKFFSLPPELRTQVYHELWKDTPQINYRRPEGWDHRDNAGWRGHPFCWLGSPYMILVYGDYDRNPIRYNVHNISWGPTRLPMWLLASKQMLREGLAQLRLKSTLVMSQCFDPFYGLHSSLVRPINDVQSLTITNLDFDVVQPFTENARLVVPAATARQFPSDSSPQLGTKLRGIRMLRIEFAHRTNGFSADKAADVPHCIAGLLSALENLETFELVEQFTWRWKMTLNPSSRPHPSRAARLPLVQELVQDAVAEHGRVISADEAFEQIDEHGPNFSWRWTYTFKKRTHDTDTLEYWRSVRRTRERVIRDMHKGFLGSSLRFAKLAGAGRTDLSSVLQRQ
ncbi:hypothetical protein P171DRAFT_93451 [Karstenula rhodostoma CBS 690.94]|uniref:Uncharacterized protein n=1 Tax=Karstenula rhodostoma CBS 690.94 TaxID=1392251 RepID=A0A9P4PDW9_9PLEO|nr:hypothetical protein P171DRAFT_93451 [Karstenula rhodostoma CBS 690.94]